MDEQALFEHARAMVAPIAPVTLKPADPKEPPADPPATTNPRRHEVVAWRHVGALETTRHPSKESALEYAGALSWVVFYKYAVMDGREMIARAEINPPADISAADLERILG